MQTKKVRLPSHHLPGSKHYAKSPHPTTNATIFKIAETARWPACRRAVHLWRVVLRKRKRVGYQSGEMATISSIYEIQHKNCLRDPVIVLEGQRFPKCPKCRGNISFRLQTAAPHIRSDKDFSK
jgi:hypothetical protein